MEADSKNIEMQQERELARIRADIKAAREEKSQLDKEISQETPKKIQVQQEIQNESFITETTTPNK